MDRMNELTVCAIRLADDRDLVLQRLKETPNDKGLLRCLASVDRLLKYRDKLFWMLAAEPCACMDCERISCLNKDGIVDEECIGCYDVNEHLREAERKHDATTN